MTQSEPAIQTPPQTAAPDTPPAAPPEPTGKPAWRQILRRLDPRQVKWRAVWHWFITHPLDLFLALAALTSLTLFLNPLPYLANYVDKLPFGFSFLAVTVGTWLIDEGGINIAAGIATAVTLSVLYVRVRQHIVTRQSLWSTVCPNCNETYTLHRVHRTRGDKLLNTIGYPVRRYQCRACQWEGRRIDEERF